MNTDPNPIPETHGVARALVLLVTLVCRHPRAVLVLGLLLATASGWYFATHTHLRTQRDDLVSPDKPSQQRWRRHLAEFGDDEDMVVVVRGIDRAKLKAALDEVARRALAQPDRFDRVFHCVDLRPLRRRALLFLPTDQLDGIRDNLRRMTLLLEVGNTAWRNLGVANMVAEARLRVTSLRPGTPPGPADEPLFAQTQAVVATLAATLEHPANYRNPWRSLAPPGPAGQGDLLSEPQYFFSPDGSLGFLLVRPIKEEGSFTAADRSVAALRTLVAEVGRDHLGVEIGLTGLPVLENDAMAASESDTRRASWLALLGVGTLFLVVFRGPRYPLLTVGTLLLGTAWAMGWLTLTVGHLNILSATFAVMLIGMGDYGVLWVTRYDQYRAVGDDVRSALLRTAARGGPSIFTAALATATAFLATLLADFQAVGELGWIAGSGVLLCAFACFTILPALLLLTDRRGDRVQRPSVLPLAASPTRTAAPVWLPFLTRRPRLVAAVSLGLTALLAGAAGWVKYDHNLLNMQARDLESVTWERTLLEHTAGTSWYAFSSTATAAEARALKAAYEQVPTVTRVVEVASLIPEDQEVKLERLRDIQARLRHLPPRATPIPHARPERTALLEGVRGLRTALEPQAGGPVVAGLRDDLALLAYRLASAPDEVGEELQLFDERLAYDLAQDLHQLRDVSHPEPITLADLPGPLRERFVGQSGRWLLQVFGKDLWDHDNLASFVTAVAAVDPEATGKPFGTLEGLRELRSGFERAGLYALLGIFLVFLVDFRDLRWTILALLPLGLGVALSLGVMGLAGLPLNPANIIGFPLVVGVGAVYGVHVVHDYLRRPPGEPYALSFVIGRAILVMALTNALSFGTLMVARHRGLAGLGLFLALGVACCMVAALVFLPAVLRLRSLGRLEQAATSSVVRRAA